MPKDYKNFSNKKSPGTGRIQVYLSFLTGLTIGLFVSFVVYLNIYEAGNKIVNTPELVVENTSKTQSVSSEEDLNEDNIPEPEYDFYTILPNMEVNVSEWEAEEENSPGPVSDKDGLYILQVGSFKEYSAADEVKAKLALMGIKADIQRVVINGRDIRHRVRIGPYKDLKKLHAARELLFANNFDFMLLKLKINEI